METLYRRGANYSDREFYGDTAHSSLLGQRYGYEGRPRLSRFSFRNISAKYRKPLLALLIGFIILWFILIMIALFLPVTSFLIALESGGMNRPAFFDPSIFPVVADLEANADAIRQEALAVLNKTTAFAELEQYSSDLAPNTEAWQSFFLRMYTWDIDRNMAACPVTAALLRRHASTTTLAQFSILNGPTRLHPHMGYFSGVIRLQLALTLPADCTPSSCFISVDRTVSTWTVGKVIAFDDSHVHRVVMDGVGHRIVLFLDVIRPGMHPLLRLATQMIMRFATWVPPGSGLYSNAVAASMAW